MGDPTGSAQALAVVIGRRLREVRERAGSRQEDVAASARGFRINWSRATVAAIEIGRRRLSVEEFLLLPLILRRSAARDGPGIHVSLCDLLLSGQSGVEMAPGLTLTATTLRPILTGGDPQKVRIDELPPSETELRQVMLALEVGDVEGILRDVWPDATRNPPVAAQLLRDAVNEAEQKLALVLVRKYGGDASHQAVRVAAIARKLFGKSLTEMREEELSKAKRDQSARTIQALRGHITRRLTRRITAELEAVDQRREDRASEAHLRP